MNTTPGYCFDRTQFANSCMLTQLWQNVAFPIVDIKSKLYFYFRLNRLFMWDTRLVASKGGLRVLLRNPKPNTCQVTQAPSYEWTSNTANKCGLPGTIWRNPRSLLMQDTGPQGERVPTRESPSYLVPQLFPHFLPHPHPHLLLLPRVLSAFNLNMHGLLRLRLCMLVGVIKLLWRMEVY